MSSKPRILIVDDEPTVRLVFRTTLESVGYEIHEAADGQAALEYLHRNQVELVLLDLRMPVMDGMATLRKMRDEALATPVVIVTAHGSVPDAVEAMKLGAIDFVQKPVSPTELRRVAADVLARHRSEVGEPKPGPQATLDAAKREINRRDFDEARRLLDRGDELELAEARYLRGLLLEQRGERDRALSVYRDALAADPNFEPARRRLENFETP
jgi:DNA-binding NtrC family response regulator